ncbi:MAG: hypothetical protein WC861_03340 [Candidatus Micrarchaeia archaeon]|jgi:hypothetical protein
MGNALYFSLLLLCAPIFAAAAVGQASSQNIALAPSLLGAANACGAPERLPSAGDIFSVADARIVSLVPQVSNATTDLQNASAIWSWSASFPPSARFSIRDDMRCPAGEIRYFAPSSPSLSGELSYRYGNSTTALLLSSSGPNPAPLNLSSAKLAGADFLQPFAPLSLSLSATISVSYSFAKSGYSYRCTSMGGYTGCGCEVDYSQGIRAFHRTVSDARNFSVEVGPDSVLWLNPPLSSRLSGNGTGRVALFARRLPASISLVSNGREIASVQPYLFSAGTGPCGEAIAGREFSPPPQAASGVFINAGAPIFPYQLVDKNASYVPFYLEFPWHASAGKANFTIIIEDAFSRKQEFPREFSVREPAPFSSPGAPGGSIGAMAKRQASDGVAAAAYPSRQQQGAFPDFSIVAAAFALPFAIGAAALARRLAWL